MNWRLFEFSVDVAMLTRRGHQSAYPVSGQHAEQPAVQVWLDPADSRGTPVGSSRSDRTGQTDQSGAGLTALIGRRSRRSRRFVA